MGNRRDSESVQPKLQWHRIKEIEIKDDMKKSITIFGGAFLGTLSVFWVLNSGHGFNLSDEGFYIYGSQRVLQGEVPPMDFMGYEPARYAWTAAFFWLWSSKDNIIARLATGIAAGIICALTIAGGQKESVKLTIASPWIAVVCGACLATWMFPYYRAYDNLTALYTYWLCRVAYLSNSKRQLLLAGLASGATVFAGRNHSLYCVIAMSLIVVARYFRWPGKKVLGDAAVGLTGTIISILTGYILIEAVKPAYIRSTWDSWAEIMATGKTNISLPYPWPWNIEIASGLGELEGALVISICFMVAALAGPIMYVVGIVRLQRGCKVNSRLIAVGAAMTGYIHCTTSRADMVHIATTLMPLIAYISDIAIFGDKRLARSIGIATQLALALRISIRNQTFYHCLRGSYECVEVKVDNGTHLIAEKGIAEEFMFLKELTGRREFIVLPALPGLYVANGIKSPIWDIYSIWPRSKTRQAIEIKELKKKDVEMIVLKLDPSGKSMDPRVNSRILWKFLEREYHCKKQFRRGNGEYLVMTRAIVATNRVANANVSSHCVNEG